MMQREKLITEYHLEKSWILAQQTDIYCPEQERVLDDALKHVRQKISKIQDEHILAMGFQQRLIGAMP